MTSALPKSTGVEPVHIELEFVRAKEAEDAFAFRFTRQAYLVRSRQGSYETAELPWNRELLRDLEEIRRPDRDPATVARVGALLREFLDPAGWGGHEAAIVAARTQRRRVHLTIRSAAAELYALPWELLTLRTDGQHLGALDHVLLRYAWPGTTTVEADEASARPRVLVAWSAAGGGVPAADQTRAIEAARGGSEGDGGDEGDGTVECIGHATYGRIADALEAAAAAGRPFAALHLLCHGAEAGSTFGLSLDGEEGGRAVVVDAGRLQQLLSPHAHALRLVVVAACDGGNMGEPGNRIGSVAQRLHRAGIQYVVASRYPLSSRGSTRMTGALYGALMRGASVERAFVEARSAAAREVAHLDWASLQLYARPEDGDHGCVLAPIATADAPSPAVVPEGRRSPAVTATTVPTSAGGMPRWVAAGLGAAAIAGLAGLAYWAVARPSPPDEVARTSDDAIARDASDAGTPVGTTARDVGAAGSTTGTTARDADAAGSTTRDGTTAQDGATQDDTHGDDANRDQTRPEPRRRPPGVDRSRPSRRCPSSVKERINDRLGAPAGGGSYRVEVWVFEDGSTKLQSCDCGDRYATVASTLSRMKSTLSPPSLKSELPCMVKFEWQ